MNVFNHAIMVCPESGLIQRFKDNKIEKTKHTDQPGPLLSQHGNFFL